MGWESSIRTLTQRGWQRRDVIDALLRLLRSPEFHWRMTSSDVGRTVGRPLDELSAGALLGIARTWLLGEEGEREALVHCVRTLDEA